MSDAAADRPNWQGNGSFVEGTKLQRVWDSTSIGALKRCPRAYQLAIIEGWEPRERSADLAFGIWLHGARERYYHAKAEGQEHDASLLAGLKWLLAETFDVALGRPWVSGDSAKCRETLVRSYVWYCDRWREDALETVILADGKPAVELTFRFPTDYAGPGGVTYELAGHLDRLATLGTTTYISDLKSTKHALNTWYFDDFTPGNQFSLYSLAARVVWSVPTRGILVDAVQVGVSFTRFLRGEVGRTQDQLDEWYRDLGEVLKANERYVAQDYWPQNDVQCYRCAFRGVCSKSPGVREKWLRADFQRKVWDPTKARGDI